MKIKVNKKMKADLDAREEIAIEYDVDDLIERYNAVFDEVSKIAIGKYDEILAIKLALLTKQHVMLEGLHGIAKSMLARAVSKRILGVVYFEKLLMKNTQAEELFGVMSTKLFREKEVWHHNTTGMLPTAHIAFLDEIYNASDSLLPTTLTLLNERKFANGGVIESCPLITAISACNVVPEGDELNAFKDRWMFSLKVEPLKTSAERVKALDVYLDDIADQEPKATITLDEICALSALVKTVKVSAQIKELYAELVSNYRSRAGGRYISDRRFCHAFRIAQVMAVLEQKNTLPVEMLYHTKHAFVKSSDVSDDNNFAEAYKSVVGDLLQFNKEQKQLEDIKELLSKMQAKFDPAMGRERLEKLYMKAKQVVDTFANTPAESLPTSTLGKEKIQEYLNGFTTLVNSCQEQLNLIPGNPAPVS